MQLRGSFQHNCNTISKSLWNSLGESRLKIVSNVKKDLRRSSFRRNIEKKPRIPGSRLKEQLRSIGKKVRKILFFLRTSSAANRMRTDANHVKHILRYGKKAWSCLADAGINGSVEDVERSLADNGNINCQDRRGNTILIYCIWSYNMPLLHYLLEREDVDITIINSQHKNALIIALELSNILAVYLLAQRGAVKDAEHKFLYPIHVLCHENHFNLILLAILLQHGADINSSMWQIGTPLQYAAKSNNRKLAYLLWVLGGRLYPEVPIRPDKLFCTSYDTFQKEFCSIILPYQFVKSCLSRDIDDITKIFKLERHYNNSFNASSKPLKLLEELVKIGAVNVETSLMSPLSRKLRLTQVSDTDLQDSYISLGELSFFVPCV